MTERKTLYLVRHAKSDWPRAGLTDFDRPLNSRGLRDAPEMGRRMKQRGVSPEVIVCSPAKRTIQTLELLDFGVEHIVFEERIYSASIGAMLDIIHSLDDGCRSAMLVGHNPTMTQLVGWLSGANIGDMPTCAVATIELGSGQWKDVGTCAAQLLNFDYPRKMG